jgi:hypothetical protein
MYWTSGTHFLCKICGFHRGNYNECLLGCGAMGPTQRHIPEDSTLHNHSLTKVLSWHLPGGTEEGHEKPQGRITIILAEIQIMTLMNMSFTHYQYTISFSHIVLSVTF